MTTVPPSTISAWVIVFRVLTIGRDRGRRL